MSRRRTRLTVSRSVLKPLGSLCRRSASLGRVALTLPDRRRWNVWRKEYGEPESERGCLPADGPRPSRRPAPRQVPLKTLRPADNTGDLSLAETNGISLSLWDRNFILLPSPWAGSIYSAADPLRPASTPCRAGKQCSSSHRWASQGYIQFADRYLCALLMGNRCDISSRY